MTYRFNQQTYDSVQSGQMSRTFPIKSPSPDKKSSNIITPTRSPQLQQIKRNMTPSKQRPFQPIQYILKQSNLQQSTRYYTNQDFQQYRSSKRKSYDKEQLHYLPQEFSLGEDQLKYSRQEIDYVRKLQEKERTIKELHQIIEMINKNNSLDLSNSQEFFGGIGNIHYSNTRQSNQSKTSNDTYLNASYKTVQTYKNNDLSPQKQLKNQVRILTIQNQQLINLIQKYKQNQDEKQSLIRDKLDFQGLKMRQQILSREIQQLKESLQMKNSQQNKIIKSNQDLYQRLNYSQLQYQSLFVKHNQLEQQNQRLMRIMKDKQFSDKKFNSVLYQSNISQKSQTKQKLSLVKIKDQYNENLKAFRQRVYQQIDDQFQKMQHKIHLLQQKLQKMQDNAKNFQQFKSIYDNLNAQKRNEDLSASRRQGRQQKTIKKQIIQDLSQIHGQQNQKYIHQQIESLLMQKTSRYQKQLQTQRSSKQQLLNRHKKLQRQKNQIQQNYQHILKQNTELQRKLKESVTNNMEQIQDINVRNKDFEIKKLRDLIKNLQQEYQHEKNQLSCHIQHYKQQVQSSQSTSQQLRNHLLASKQTINSLQAKINTYERTIQQQKLTLVQKNKSIQIKINQKQQQVQQIRRNSSQFQSQIQGLKDYISEIQHHNRTSTVDAQLEMQLESLKMQLASKINLLAQKEQQNQQKTEQITQIRLKLAQKTTQLIQKTHRLAQRTHELQQATKQNEQKDQNLRLSNQQTQSSIKMLIQNYQAQINILKSTSINYIESINEKSSQINRLIKQIQNSQQLLLNTSQISKGQIEQLKQKIQYLQQTLSRKQNQSAYLQDEKLSLTNKNSQMEQHLSKLLTICHQVEDLQSKNKHLNQRVVDLQSHITYLKQNIQNQKLQIEDHQQNQNILQRKIHTLNQLLKDHQNLKRQFSQIHQSNQKIRKQSQQDIYNKQIQLQKQQLQRQSIKQTFIEKINTLQQKLSSLQKQNTKQIQYSARLHQSYIKLQQQYNQIISLKDDTLMPQLNELRKLVIQNMNKITSTTVGTKQYQYDIGKLAIQYQTKIQEVQQLNLSLDQLRQLINKQKQQKLLLSEKIKLLQNNIALSELSLKQRKTFCETLISQKSKLQKQLLLIKKIKLQTKTQESNQVKSHLLQRVNRLVDLQQNRQKKIFQYTNRQYSPIRKITQVTMSAVRLFQIEKQKVDISDRQIPQNQQKQ